MSDMQELARALNIYSAVKLAELQSQYIKWRPNEATIIKMARKFEQYTSGE
jgi:hypothetical protein